MSPADFLQFFQLALEKEAEKRFHSQWVTMLPFMSMKMLKYMSFEEYKAKVTGKNIDLRPDAEILAEVEEIERKFAEERRK